MTKVGIAHGVAHKVPADMYEVILSFPKVLDIWENITLLARNEWICWVLSAKKLDTRNRRIRIMCENLRAGKHRPCCWAGCMHR